MRLKFIVFTLAFAFLFSPQALASSFFEVESGLLFKVSESYVLKDESSGTGDKFLRITPPGGNISVFEITISDRTLDALLQDFQLRYINVTQLSNRELLGQTGVELTGTSFTGTDPRKAFVFQISGKSVAIVYLGSNPAEFEQFLDSLQRSSGFIDSYSHPLANEIGDVANRKIFAGYQEGDKVLFKPEQGINRAEFLKVLVLSQRTQAQIDQFYEDFKAEILLDDQAVLKDGNPTTQPLLWDVDRNAWFASYIFFAFDQGWVQGYPDGSFKPGNLINIAETTKILLESRNQQVQPNSTVWFEPYLQFFASSSILRQANGQYQFAFTERKFYPHENCSRAQAAGFLSRLFFLDEHPQFGIFGRVVPPEGLDFSYQSGGSVSFLEVTGTEGSERSFQIYPSGQNQPTASISVYLPEVWTDLERSGQLRSRNMVYLGENKTYVFASKSICNTSADCVADLKKHFQLKKSDLTGFDDPNMSFRFFYNQALQFEKIIEAQLETLILLREDRSQMLILSLFKGDDFPFAGQTPLSQYVIGNQEWNAYVETVKGAPRLSLVVTTDRHVIVASVPGLEQVAKVDAKVFRILRTLEIK